MSELQSIQRMFGAQTNFSALIKLQHSSALQRIYTPTNAGSLDGNGDFTFLQRLPTLHLFDTRPALFYPQLVLWIAVYSDVWLAGRRHSGGSG